MKQDTCRSHIRKFIRPVSSACVLFPVSLVNYITIKEANLDLFPFAQFVTSQNSTKNIVIFHHMNLLQACRLISFFLFLIKVHDTRVVRSVCSDVLAV